MSHRTVHLTINEDDESVDDGKTHLCVKRMGSQMVLCTGEVFGFGEGAARGIVKTVNRGGINCKNCLDEIHELKSVKL